MADSDAATNDPKPHEGNIDTQTSIPPASSNEAKLAEAIAQRDKYLNLAQRTQAEFENYQKRVFRDTQSERKYAVMPLARDLLPVLDNLDRAMDAMKGKSETESLLSGIELVRKMFIDGLSRNGIEAVSAVDVPFDPNFHEAVMQQPSMDKPPLTVLNVLQAGYKLHDRVVRPAQVVVSTAVDERKKDTE